ncbi:hypothetical protein ACVWZV_001147 [Bradyrhizobium sp. GM5.1]
MPSSPNLYPAKLNAAKISSQMLDPFFDSVANRLRPGRKCMDPQLQAEIARRAR